jgi:hypothetical protein
MSKESLEMKAFQQHMLEVWTLTEHGESIEEFTNEIAIAYGDWLIEKNQDAKDKADHLQQKIDDIFEWEQSTKTYRTMRAAS